MSAPTVAAAESGVLPALLEVEAGLYAITFMTRQVFSDGIEADKARLGILYITLKLERDLRAVIDPLADA